MQPNEAKERLTSLLTEHKITMRAVFVPFSQSRNKGEKTPSLNWVVTFAAHGRDFLITDYMQGSAHCPGYKQTKQYERRIFVAYECEHGRRRNSLHGNYGGKPIDHPDIADVFSCLLSDADAIDYATFEDYAQSMGGNVDSIREEKIYRHCLEIALKIRAALGEDTIRNMREAAQDM